MIVGVIPARYASSRFPGKPLTNICGKPMIYWVYQQAKKAKGIDEVYVATDDVRIVEECNKYSMNVLITSTNHSTGTDRLGEVAQHIYADYYINIQGDEPLIEPETIEKVVDRILSDNSVDIVNSMTLIKEKKDIESDSCVKVVTNCNNRLVYFSRLPIPYPKNGQVINYYKHLGLYALKREALVWFSNQERGKIEKIEDIEMMRFLENGYSIEVVDVQSDTIAVDRPDDVKRVEAEMIKRGQL